MKRFCTTVLALLLLTLSLASCATKTTGGAKTTASTPDRSTDTQATGTAPADPGDGYSKNY